MTVAHSTVLVQREWDNRLCVLRESKQMINCDWIYRFGANPGVVDGRLRAALPVLALGRRSGRVPALPYPPPRLYQCTTLHSSWSTWLALARRRASAAASFCRLAVQIASARPASLSAGVM
jgi:hypothetical protein